jgi:hypothetical protein
MRWSAMNKKFVLVSMILMFVTAFSWAQSGTTSLHGVVTDKSGASVGDAKVTLNNSGNGAMLETKTNAVGEYEYSALAPGNYDLRIEAPGFQQAEFKNIQLLVNTPGTRNVVLEIGSSSQTVEVSSQTEQLNTTDATLGEAFESRRILALPFEGRDAAGVLSLQPGVSFIPNPNIDRTSATNGITIDTRNGALNGGRSDQANITLDGVDNNDQLLGLAFQGAVRSTLDSIEEFRVITGGANADQGRSSGGQVTLVTKSGTNSFHGSAYMQNRSRIGEANEWFNKHQQLNNGEPNTPPELVRNVFGGALGGPIKKDRLFFFLTYEGSRQNQNVQVNRNVPGTNLRNGMVSYPDANGSVTTLTAAQIAQMDPNCSALGTCPAGPGPDQAAIAQFNKYPTPNSTICPNNDGFNNISCFTFSASNPIHLNTSIAKLDYNLNRSGTHRLFLRGNYQSDSDAGPPQFPGLPPNSVSRDTSRALAAGYTAVFSSTLVNTFRYGFTRQSQTSQGLQTQPIVSFRFVDDLTAASATRSFHVPVHNWVDDVSWTKGKHTLQFGTNIRLITNSRTSNATSFNAGLINPAFLNANPAGSGGSLDPGAFGFPAVDPNNVSVYNNAVVDLVGIVTQVTGNYNRDHTGTTLPAGAPVPRNFRSWEYEWYLQDVWRATPNLTITAGLRYTLLEPPYETNGNQASPNISLNNFVNTRAQLMEQGMTTAPAFGFDLSGQANGKQPYWPYDYKDLGPRIALAYAPNPSGGLLKALFGDRGKSSIRAGYGIVYDHFGEGIVNSFDQNGTFGLSTSITNAASIQTVDGGARFTGVNNIPASSANGVLLSPPPAGGFPAIPNVSTLGNPVQQIFFGLDDKLKTPYSELVDLSFSRELPGGFTFQAAYVGRFAHRLLQQRDLAMPLNLKDPKSGQDYFTAATIFAKDVAAGTPVQNVTPIPFFEHFFPAAAGVSNAPGSGFSCGDGTPGNGGAPGLLGVANPTATQAMYELFFCNSGPGTFGETNALNILDSFCFPACVNQQVGQLPAAPGQPGGPFQIYNPQFSALYAWSSIGKSGYNAGQFTLSRRLTHGLQFDFNYTLSKSLDVGSDAERTQVFGGLSALINTWAPFQFKGPSDFDARHAINFNMVFELPFGRGRRFGHDWNRALNLAAGGWEFVGLGRWSSGLPFSVTNGFDFPTNFQLPGNAELIGPAPKTGRTAIGPNGDPFAFVAGPAADVTNFQTGQTPIFRFAFPGESGQRNNFRGDGYFGVDAGVNKSFQFTERVALRLSAYAFNLTNSVRFDPAFVSANLQQAASFGQYSNTLTTSRRMEFAARVIF